MDAKHSLALCQRKNQVELTLRHLRTERLAVENNPYWLHAAAYKNRVLLLDQIAEWYLEELREIDRAILDSQMTTNAMLPSEGLGGQEIPAAEGQNSGDNNPISRR